MNSHPTLKCAASVSFLLAAGAGSVKAGLLSVTETNLVNGTAAVIAGPFSEDCLGYNDRVHQFNGAAFNPDTGLLSASGTQIAGIPDYLDGQQYVQFDNDARAMTGYSAVITADTHSTFYLLLDTRINGPNTSVAKTNTTDPVLGGALQWVLDAGWERVNTGLSPNGQGDYIGIDEGGEGVGAGMGLNNFMAVYKYPVTATQVTVKGGPGGNMHTLVAVPAAPPTVAVSAFAADPLSVLPGGQVTLNWLISQQATAATIDQGVGDVLPLTDNLGSGTLTVNPQVNTTYILSVTTPTGPGTASASVVVRPLVSYTSSRQRIKAGESVELRWQVRPDAAVSIGDIGDVSEHTDPATGAGSVTVEPETTTDYLLSAEAEGLVETARASVLVLPEEPGFALIDIGATGGRTEPGAVSGRTVGGAAVDVNNTNLAATPLIADTGTIFTLALDNLDPDGNPVGGLDWRDRGDAPNLPLNRLGEDFVKNNLGLVRVVLGQLPAGDYEILSYHCDPANVQSGNIRILVTDANGTAVDTGVTGNASWPATGLPGLGNLTTSQTASTAARFPVRSNGTDEVVVYFDSRDDALDKELPLNGLWILKAPPPPADNTWALVDIGAVGGQAEPGAAEGMVIGAGGNNTSGNLVASPLTSRTGVSFQLALDNLSPDGTSLGTLDWRDRGDAADVPMARFAEAFVKNGQGMVRAVLSGLPAGRWEIRSYHLDPTHSQTSSIRILVSDATRPSAGDTGVTGDASYAGHPADTGAPQFGGVWAGLVESKAATFTVTSNGTDDVVIYFDSSADGVDKELPLTGLRISPAGAPAQVIPVTQVLRTVSGGTASVAVTFTSDPGQTYSVYASADPAAWGAPLTTTLAATGTSTTWTENDIPLTATRRFYQIRRN